MLTVKQSDDDLAQQIVYAVSHDLLAPTRHIQAFVEILGRHLDGQLDDVGIGYMDRLIGAADVFDQKLKALTRFSRVVSRGEEIRPCAAGEAVAEAVASLQDEITAAEADVIVGDLPMVIADRAQLTVLFNELLDNALKFGPDGQTITITAPRPEVEPAAAGLVAVAITDDGPGFEPRHSKTAFELFRRFHDVSVPGTGTGLAIVERIVDRHQGRVRIDTDADHGARVVVSLPPAERGTSTAVS